MAIRLVSDDTPQPAYTPDDDEATLDAAMVALRRAVNVESLHPPTRRLMSAAIRGLEAHHERSGS